MSEPLGMVSDYVQRESGGIKVQLRVLRSGEVLVEYWGP